MTQIFFEDRENQSPEQRETDLMSRLAPHLQQAIKSCPGLAAHLKGIDVSAVTSRRALAELPVLRKTTLMQAQAENPPFGGFADATQLSGTRIFMSPGPVWEPQPPGLDPWMSARALFAAGIRSGDRVHNAFSYHMTPGGFIIDEGARALGCLVFPAGVGNTEAQVDAIRFYEPSAYLGTPDYLKTLLDKAEESDHALTSISRALVSGGALFPSLRSEYEARGVSVLQAYATADLGVIAYESSIDGNPVDGMVCNEDLIVEIVRPGTDTPVADGEVGELVVTNFNSAYPLIRFGTGDLSCVLPDPSPCGRTNLRLKGWMGRADQRTKVKGMFVDPKQVQQLVDSQAAIEKARLVVRRDNDTDSISLMVAGKGIDPAALQESMHAVLKLKGSVELVEEPLPNDGLVIADERDYDQ